VAARLVAAGRKHRVGRRLVENGHFRRADRDGHVLADRSLDAEFLRLRHDLVDGVGAELFLGEADRNGVDRFRQRRLHVDPPGIGIAVIAGAPVAPGDRRVDDRRIRRHALLHRQRIGIDLERRARLAQRPRGAVELAFAIVAPADHRAHSPAVLDQHEGCLLDVVALAIFAQVGRHRLFGRLLQADVDRRAHHQRMVAVFGGDLLHLLEGPVEEVIGRLHLVAVDDGGRIAPCGDHLALGHQPALHQVGEHHIGARAGRRQVDMRGIFRRCLEQAGEHGGFGKIDLGQRLAEIELRGGRSPERAAAHIGAVEIERQDLLLRQIGLQPQRQIGFLDLALDRPLIGEEQVLGQLLGQRRSALDHRAGLGILAHGARQSEEVDAEMLEEAPVLGRQHRLDQVVGQFVDRHGILVDDAAMADQVAVAVEKGDGEVAVISPVLLGLLEGRLGERQHQHRAGGAERHGFAEHFEEQLLPAARAKTAEEDGDLLPDFRECKTGIPQRRIDPAVDPKQDVALELRLLLFRRAILGHLQTIPGQSLGEKGMPPLTRPPARPKSKPCAGNAAFLSIC